MTLWLVISLLDPTALAMLIGVLVGLLAAVPALLILLQRLRERADRDPGVYVLLPPQAPAEQIVRHIHEHHVVLPAGGVPQPMIVDGEVVPQRPAVWTPPTLQAQDRRFRVVGEREPWDDGW
jgi:hypothetical protein